MTTQLFPPRKVHRVQRAPQGPSLTEQCHRKTCDINRIIAKYKKTGHLQQHLKQGYFGDFTSAQDFKTSFDRINDALNDFQAMPAQVRKRFHNNPVELLQFLNDESNRAEAIELGLIERSSNTSESEPSEATPVDPVTEPKITETETNS